MQYSFEGTNVRIVFTCIKPSTKARGRWIVHMYITLTIFKLGIINEVDCEYIK